MTKEERVEAIKAFIQEKEMEIEALSQEPREDAVSRKAVFDALEKVAELFPWRVPGKYDTYDRYNEAWHDAIGRAEMEIEGLPPVNPQPKTGHCKDCKYFEYDSVAKVDGIPLIVAHDYIPDTTRQTNEIYKMRSA